MTPLTNPLVWLARFRHRCGYGVHSPFAFRFITDVIYERQPFYAYQTLTTLLPTKHLFRRKRGLELLLRLANYQQPNVIAMQGEASLPTAYLHAGCRRAQITPIELCRQAQLCYLTQPDDRAASLLAQGGMLILDNLHHHRQWFRQLPATLHFDLYDLGIALFALPYHPQYYVVNF